MVIDFPQSTYRGKNVISITDSGLARAIRLGLHQAPVKKTRAVIDLSKDMTVQYTSEFLEQENTLIITLLPNMTEMTEMTEPMTGPQATAVQDIQAKSPEVQPSQEELSENLLNKKTMTQVSSVKEEKMAPVAESTAMHHDPEKVRVVLDLAANRDYDLQQVFFRKDNLFVLIVNELTPDQGAQ